MLPPGFERESHEPPRRHGGFLTWAAKPRVRESPAPLDVTDEPCQSHLSPADRPLDLKYVPTASEVPFSAVSDFSFLDEGFSIPVAEKNIRCGAANEHIKSVFCERL